MDSAADKIHDDLIEFTIRAERVAASLARTMFRHLGTLQVELVNNLHRYDPTDPKRKSFQEARLKRVIEVATKLISETYRQIYREETGALGELGYLEHVSLVSAFNRSIGVEFGMPTIDRKLMKAIIENQVIMGATRKEWWDQQDRARRLEVARGVRSDLIAGRSITQMVERFRPKGDWEAKARRQVEAQVRTNVLQTLNDVRRETYRENEDIIEAVEHVSTLDSRTTDICISKDGLRWTWPEVEPIGHDKDYVTPPLHFMCRSTIAPILVPWSELIGTRKTGPLRSREAYRNGLKEGVPQRAGESQAAYDARIDRLLENNRASIDGPLTAKEKSMESFLKANPGRAEEMLGKGRAGLFLDGKITLQELTDQRSRPLTLAQLQEMVDRKR